jgi:hypothetical protein
MPRWFRVGVHLFAAYLVLSIVAGYGWDKEKGQPSETWTVIGLAAAAVAFLVLELYTHHRADGRWLGGSNRRRRWARGRRPPGA